MRFAEMTAPDVRDLSREATLILAPIAACEQHSRHLPVFTDSILVGAVAAGAAYWEIAEAEIAALCAGPRKTMGHACEIETSMVMHLRPDLVRKDRILDDPDDTPGGLKGLFWARDFGRRTDHGAVGHP